MKFKRYLNALLVCMGVIVVIALCIGCSNKGSGHRGVGGLATTTQETTIEENKRYNAQDIVVVTNVDSVNETITVKKVDDTKEFVLTYNGGTLISSKYGTQLLMEQVPVGEVAWIGYMAGTQKLLELKEYDSAWENTSVTRWDVDYDKRLIIIGSNTYSYDDSLFITSDGKKPEIREISGIDHLTVRGIGNKVCSVTVDKGHGFVRLTDTSNYVDGIVEIGERISAVIVADMVIAAPEGVFELTATINGVGGSKKVSVIRGQETVVSLGAFEQAVTRYGTVKLNVLPEDADATVSIDGVEMDYSDHMSIAYGTHTMKVTSNNYDTVEREITISSPYATIGVNMDADKDDEDTEKEEVTSGNEGETTTEEGTTSNPGSSNGLICITAPEGAKVYFDGAYMGTAPVSFKKVPGEHTIILKKDGYVTKSYTIDVADDDEDMILNFPAMLKE